ncbi:MAG TPA: LuxR C-terminal-related transcriptional regulator [Pseudonocardiaceae bacterium]|nr:LuxR C-terminal-related transcriptional regulator [Pseudonocardiaceae bacterium]
MSGRVREFCALQAERQRSALGELRVALVLGDAGLGKTRLAAELLPRDDELAVGLIAHSSPLGGMPLFGPWAGALGLHADAVDAEGICHACGSVLGGLPALIRRAEIAHDALSRGEAFRCHFVEWIPDLLAKASADRPIVVVLDDAHHSDDAVWEMLLRLAWDFPASRLFVLATARPAELAKHRMAVEVLHALEQEAMVCRIQLSPFSWEDVRELAAENFGRDRVPSALVDWLMTRAQGNPRCAAGLLEVLVDNGADLQVPALGGVPEKLARWVRTEMARLDLPALVLIEVLALIGDLVDPGDLARITGQPIENVALALEQLAHSGMVVEQQHDRSLGYQVAHPLAREVLYTDIGGARRRVMHRRVAETLLESGRTEVAASHFVRAAQAGDGEAIDALIEMAQRAEQRGLCSQVWTIVSGLRDLLPIGDERWFGLFDALFQRSNWGIVDCTEYCVAEMAVVKQMRQLLAGIGDLQRQADVRLWLAGLFAFGAGDLDAAQGECRQALALCQRAGSEPAARMAAIKLAKMRGWAGDLRGEEQAARQLLSEAERAGDQRGIAEALGALGHTLGWQGRFDAAENVLMRSVELATAAARFSWMSQSLALLASLDACRGHLVSARTRWAQAAASSPHYDPMIGGCGAFIELVAGDLTMVAAHARQWESHDPAARTCLPVRLAGRAAMAAAERGCLTEARRNLDAMTRADSRTLGVLEPLYWWAEGVVARVEGRWAAAAAALQRTVDCYSAMNAWALRGFVLADLAEVTVVAGDPDAAARAATSAEDNARRTGAPIHQALHLLATTWALVGQGRRDLAARAALRAMDGFDSSGYALLAARARVAYANAVGGSDRRAAENALCEAVVAFDACGAVVRRDQARTLLIQLKSDGRCATDAVCGPGSLTRRERQVAELGAGGYTAAQIATRLHIGVRTVETHLARSYPKLGVTSKQQLVHRAAEFGFTPSP